MFDSKFLGMEVIKGLLHQNMAKNIKCKECHKKVIIKI